MKTMKTSLALLHVVALLLSEDKNRFEDPGKQPKDWCPNAQEMPDDILHDLNDMQIVEDEVDLSGHTEPTLLLRFKDKIYRVDISLQNEEDEDLELDVSLGEEDNPEGNTVQDPDHWPARPI